MDPWTRCDCGFELWIPVADLSVSTVGLYDDGRFPGRCIVALREHHTALEDLDDHEAAEFMGDMRAVGRAVRSLTGAPRVNYAVLGNTEPHVHCHVIPRHYDDPVPTRPPWEHPAKKFKLPGSEITRLAQQLAQLLTP